MQIYCLAQGKDWDMSKSVAQNYESQNDMGGTKRTVHSKVSHPDKTAGSETSYQNFNTQEFLQQKEAFFASKQAENAMRSEYVSYIIYFWICVHQWFNGN